MATMELIHTKVIFKLKTKQNKLSLMQSDQKHVKVCFQDYFTKHLHLQNSLQVAF